MSARPAAAAAGAQRSPTIRKFKSVSARVEAFEAARHRQAARVADQVLGSCLTYSQVMSCEAYQPFLERIRAEECSLRDRDAIQDAGEAHLIMEKLAEALPAPLRVDFHCLQDWHGDQCAADGEASYLVGFARGRGGRR